LRIWWMSIVIMLEYSRSLLNVVLIGRLGTPPVN